MQITEGVRNSFIFRFYYTKASTLNSLSYPVFKPTQLIFPSTFIILSVSKSLNNFNQHKNSPNKPNFENSKFLFKT